MTKQRDARAAEMADFAVDGARSRYNNARKVLAFVSRHLRQSLKELGRMRRPDLWAWYREAHELVSKEWEAPGE